MSERGPSEGKIAHTGTALDCLSTPVRIWYFHHVLQMWSLGEVKPLLRATKLTSDGEEAGLGLGAPVSESCHQN